MVHYCKIWMSRVRGLCDFASPRTFVKITTPIQIFCGSNIPDKNSKSIGEIPKMLWKHNCLNQYFQMFTILLSKLEFHIATYQASKKMLRNWYVGPKKTKIGEGINLLIMRFPCRSALAQKAVVNLPLVACEQKMLQKELLHQSRARLRWKFASIFCHHWKSIYQSSEAKNQV